VKSLIIWQNIGSIAKAEQSSIAVVIAGPNISCVAKNKNKSNTHARKMKNLLHKEVLYSE
jgi:hypothetical protein